MKIRWMLAFCSGMLAAVAVPVLAQNAVQMFPDVGDSAFFAPAVNALAQLGIVHGYDNGNFGPNDPVTRGQVAVMLQRYDQTAIDPLRQQVEEIRKQLNLGQCGDGTVQTGEQCDDGDKNGTQGDACSINCLTVSQASCNGHALGQAWPAPDGCNTCTCTQNGTACTMHSCSASSISKCQPYVCADGAVIASCTSDGHTIEYFADPCSTHGGDLYAASSSSSAAPPSICGNGVCEPNESAVACNPVTDPQCTTIYCPQDCASSSSASSDGGVHLAP